MSSKGKPEEPKKQCANFEPQTWRRNLCKNCFKTKTEHEAALSNKSSDTTPSKTRGPDTKTLQKESAKTSKTKTDETGKDKNHNDKSSNGSLSQGKSYSSKSNGTALSDKSKNRSDFLGQNNDNKFPESWDNVVEQCTGQQNAESISTVTETNAKTHTSKTVIENNTSTSSNNNPAHIQHPTNTGKGLVPSNKLPSSALSDNGVHKDNAKPVVASATLANSEGGLPTSPPPPQTQANNPEEGGKTLISAANKSRLGKHTSSSEHEQKSRPLSNAGNAVVESETNTKAIGAVKTEHKTEPAVQAKTHHNKTQDNNCNNTLPSTFVQHHRTGGDDKSDITRKAKQDTSDLAKLPGSIAVHTDTLGGTKAEDDKQTASISDRNLPRNDITLDINKHKSDTANGDLKSDAENIDAQIKPKILSPLSPEASNFSQVFDPPLSPKSLERYRQELFASDDNVPSPKSPTARFHITDSDDDSPTGYRALSLDNTRTSVDSLLDYDTLQGRALTVYHSVPEQYLSQISNSSQRARKSGRRRRSRGDIDDWDTGQTMAERTRAELGVSREEAMMEGTRMLMDNLREKITFLEDRCNKMEREKTALTDLLSTKKSEYTSMKDHYKSKLTQLEDDLRRTTIEKEKLFERLKLPESERGSIREMEVECAKMRKKLEEAENHYYESMDENMSLKQEIKDLHLEMEEIHDQFREDEQLEFRELQKDLEVNTKNCRILQFKLHKSERRNKQLEADKLQLDERLRQQETRLESRDDRQHVRELEEELKMAKEVSVRLHDELELVEEKRARYEEELDRVNDLLTDSESSRMGLQREIDSLNQQIDNLQRNASSNTLSVSKKTPERQASTEYGDVAQILRELQDSLERQNDLQDQLKFAEEEGHTMRKKISELEHENESVILQLAMVSAAKSGRFGKKSGLGDAEVVTEREHELRLQMELADQELKVLKRKMDEMQTLNETLIKEVKKFERQLAQFVNRDRRSMSECEEEQLRSMALDIEKLKWRLIEQDQEAVAGQRRGGRLALKKSRSLEEEPASKGSEYQADLRRQLETTQQEAGVLRDKLTRLERENERLVEEIKVFELSKGRAGPAGVSRVPKIQADDALSQNIELKTSVKKLEVDNALLRNQIQLLDERTSKLSKEVTVSLSRSQSESQYDYNESRGLRSQVRALQEECSSLRKKVRDLETKNAKLSKELDEKKAKKTKKEKKEKDKEKDRDAVKMSKDEMRSRILSQDSEIKDLRGFLKNRDEEVTRLEAELDEYREDLDKILDAFKKRERELMDEIEMLENKNNVISNLLEIVTERAEDTQKELYKSTREPSRSPSAQSDMSGVSAGSDEVFAASEKVVEKDWAEQLTKRISSLERLLAEERQKLQTAEKKLQMREETQLKQEESNQLRSKEIHVIQQELSLSKDQLKEATKKLKEVKSKASEEQEAALKDLHAKIKQQEEELRALRDEKEKEEKQKSKQSASWIWEKSEMERQVQDYKKQVDDLHAEVRKQQFKWKMAGEDIEREQKQKVAMQEQLKQLKDNEDSLQLQLKEVKEKISQVEKERDDKNVELEKEKKAAEKQLKKIEEEVAKKEDVIRAKDEIIAQKEEILKQKSKIIEQSDVKLTQYEKEIKSHLSAIQKHTTALNDIKAELATEKQTAKELQAHNVDKDKKIRSQTEELRSRDERLREKDEILEQINRRLTDRENELADRDKSIRSAMKKLQERENDLKSTEKTCQEFENQTAEFRASNKELKDKLKTLETKSSKEISELKEARDKYFSEVTTLTKEKKVLLADLQMAKESLTKENEQLKKEVNKLDLDLKQAREKLHSMRATGGMKESEIVRTLEGEKENLISEKHKLKDELNSIRKQLQEETRKWQSEREDLQNIIGEKTRLIEDNSTICKKMQNDIDKLKQQVASGQHSTPIPVTHETSGASNETITAQELLNKIQNQDLMHQAEKIGLEELYEAKVKNLQEQVQQAEECLAGLRRENDDQLALIQSSRVALADLRSKYDQGLVNWNTERKQLNEKLRSIEDTLTKQKSQEKEVEEFKAKYLKEEAKWKETENKLAALKTSTASGSAVAKKDDKLTPARGVGKVSDFRAKFETFGSSTAARRPSLSRSSSITEEGGDDNAKLIKNLQEQIKDVENTRDSERQEFIKALTSKQKEFEKESKRLKDRAAKLEEKVAELEEARQQVVATRFSAHEEQEKWSLERTRLLNELQATKKMYVQEKGRITDIVAEVKKLQALSSSNSSSSTSSNGSTKVIFSKPVEVKSLVSEDKQIAGYIETVLQRISRLVEDYEKAPPLKSSDFIYKPAPTIKRSLSSSNLEIAEGLSASASSSLLHTSSDVTRYESSTLGRARSRQKSATATSKYSSGSHSAFGSRDQSPNKSYSLSGRRSNLPKAPPSMIISPSHTPKREQSIERNRASFTETDMQHLYRKLGEIDTNSAGQDLSARKAIQNERRGIRVLTKSVSVDNPQDAVHLYRDNGSDSNGKPTVTRSKGYAAIAKIHSGLFNDAPLSKTLPASIIIGELVITPGAASLTRKARRASKMREGSESPKTARRRFFDSYSEQTKSYFSWPKRGRPRSVSATVDQEEEYLSSSEEESDNTEPVERVSRASTASSVVETRQGSGSVTSSSKPEKRSFMASLFKTVKNKKLFRRSKSVDSSPVSSTVVRAGLGTMSPGAPSTYQPPAVPLVEPSHHRAASVDAQTLLGVSAESQSSVIASIIAQREAAAKGKTSAGNSKK